MAQPNGVPGAHLCPARTGSGNRGCSKDLLLFSTLIGVGMVEDVNSCVKITRRKQRREVSSLLKWLEA